MTRWFRSMLVACMYVTAATPKAIAQVACTGMVAPAVVVRMLDAKTKAPLADSALAVVRDKEYADTLGPFEYTKEGLLRSRKGAGERAGTYDVLVRLHGYALWQSKGVRVERDQCHVKTAFLEARLKRLR